MNNQQFWLTTHNPHVREALLDWNIYLRPADRSPDREPRSGDKVLIYEQESGMVGGKRVNGGAGGIVAAADVTGEWKSRQSNGEFTLEAECHNLDAGGFLGRKELNAHLGFSEKYSMIGLGAKTGLMLLDPSKYELIYADFKRNPRHR